jgi:hypothetical protein
MTYITRRCGAGFFRAMRRVPVAWAEYGTDGDMTDTNTPDIVDRLKMRATCIYLVAPESVANDIAALNREAANTIAALRAELAEARENGRFYTDAILRATERAQAAEARVKELDVGWKSLRVIWWEKDQGQVGVSVDYGNGQKAAWVVPDDLNLNAQEPNELSGDPAKLEADMRDEMRAWSKSQMRIKENGNG